MSDVAEANTTSPPACSDKGMRDVAFRKEIRRERSKIAKRVETARVSANVPDLLRLLIAELELWTRELKMETLTLFEDTDHGRYARRMMQNPPATLSILPGYIMFPFLVVQDARDVVELVVGEPQAKALANRFEIFDGLRRQFGDAVSGLARVWDDAPHTHLEQLVTIDRHRSDLKHAAMDLCRYVDTLANLATARDVGNGRANAAPHLPVALNLAPTTPEDRLRSLRQTFDLAVKRLDSLPDTELSPTGQPFVKECADAMLAFAAWFGEQTPDDVAIHGNAYRVQYALGGLSGVIDWVALHWSVPFAKEIDQETGELVVEADAFDQAVVKAFKVPSKRHELRLQRKPLPDRTYADLEQRIEQISGLAYRLGSRLQRVAVWASEGHAPTARNGRQMTQGHNGEAGGSAGTMSRGLGWQFQDRPDGQTSAYHRELCEQYATLGCFDLLTLCGQWRELATGFTDHACRSGHHGAHVIHDAAVDRMTRLIETACADRKVEGVGRLSRCLRRPDDGHLHWALATLDELEAQLRAEASQRGCAKNKAPTSSTDSGSDDTLGVLLDDANYCLMALGDMRRDYSSMDSVSRRMVGGGEDWHFGNDGDEAAYGDARKRVDANLGRLLAPLGRLLAWGNDRGMEISKSADAFQHKGTGGYKAELCEAYELDVRNVMNALLIEQTRKQNISSTASSAPRDPAAIWLAAETMKCVTGRLLAHSMMLSIGKPSEYDDRDKMSQDFRMAEKHGYLLVSVARQLSLDAKSLTRILREDRLWEYPVEKDDVVVFRAAADVAERICTEARVWCAEAGIDPEAFLHGPATTSSIAASPKADAPVPTAPPAVVPTTSKPMTSAEPDGPAVVLGRPGMPCRVLNTEKPALTDGQHAVVAALLKAGAEGLSKDALESVRSSARRILKVLSKDSDWANVILRPGKTNGRYRIKS
jgi:hypothetical protein